MVILLMLGLVATGGLYSFLAPRPAQAVVATADDVSAGAKLGPVAPPKPETP